MLKKQQYKRVSREFFAGLSRPQNVHSSEYVAIRRFAIPGGGRSPIFMVTVSKKEVGGAVERNLLKRRYRHICKKVFSAVPPAVLQCIIKKSALTATHQELVADAASAIPRLK